LEPNEERNVRVDFARVNMKLEGWKEQLTSKAGKETLIKAVVQAIPQYAMSIFRVPISICQTIEQKVANFWWRNGESKSGLHLKNRNAMKRRQDRGGMRFKDLLSFNKAMLGKQAWRIDQNSSSLWVQVLKGLYFPNGNIWSATNGTSAS